MKEGKEENSKDARAIDTNESEGNKTETNKKGRKRLRVLSAGEEEVLEQATGWKKRKHLIMKNLGGSSSYDSVRSKLSNLGIWPEGTSVGSSNME